MPKKKQPELTPAEQKKRFEALAREVGASASEKDFKQTLGRLRMQTAAKRPARKK